MRSPRFLGVEKVILSSGHASLLCGARVRYQNTPRAGKDALQFWVWNSFPSSVLFLDFQPIPRARISCCYPSPSTSSCSREGSTLRAFQASQVTPGPWIFELEHAAMIKQFLILHWLDIPQFGCPLYHTDRRFNQHTNRSGAWIQKDLHCQ